MGCRSARSGIFSNEEVTVLLLKANPELKNVFKKLITTMKLQVAWTDIFVVTNNSLVLAGDVRSLIFNFDNKKAHTTILEIPEDAERLATMPSDDMLNNVMNITLYSFGKWGVISGLKVDKEYQALNTLFSQVLRPVGVEPKFTEDNFRFFKNGVQITYEDALLLVLRLLMKEGKLTESQSLVTSKEKANEKKDSASVRDKEDTDGQKRKSSLDMGDYENDYEIGLWHNLCWKKDSYDFKKTPQTENDAVKSRIGNNFYMTNYLCPKCGEKLYMGVYPVDKELLIETEEGRVFMARAYSCHNCNTFYTPRPGKLLQESDIYILKFDEDRTAYEDYLDILGSKAERTTNYKFNEFEAERNKNSAAENDEKSDMAADGEAYNQNEADVNNNANTDSNSNTNINNDVSANTDADTSAFKNIKAKFLKRNGKLFTKNSKVSLLKPSNIQGGTQEISENTETGTKDAPAQAMPKNTKTGITAAIARKISKISETGRTGADEQNVSAIARTDSTGTNTLNPKTSNSKNPDPESANHNSQNTEPPRAAEPTQEEPSSQTAQYAAALAQKTTDELKALLSDLERKNEAGRPGQNTNAETSHYLDAAKETLRIKLTAKYDARMGALNNLPPRQLSDLKNQIEKETSLPNEKKEEYIKEINNRLYKTEKASLEQKVELSKKKTYAEVGQIIADVENRDIPEELKQETLRNLNLIKSDRAKREAEHLITHMPLHMDRKQLSVYLDKLNQYKEADLTPYRLQLEQKMDMAEKEEISAMIKRGGKKDRAALHSLYEQLQARDYKEENKAPFLEKIHDKIRQMDEDEIERICPSIVTLSFAEGVQAYEQISQGMFLPELKTDTLEMIKRRLTKLKTDESLQLMRKLKNDMEEKMTDCGGFYFYNAREEMKAAQNMPSRSRISDNAEDNTEDGGIEASSRAAMLCAINGYAAARGTFEYPLMVCDTSRSKNGREGFVLTPDNIFYHTFLNSGVISIMDIDKVQTGRRLFSKGIFIKRFTGKKEKLPNNIKPEDWEAFTKILDDFATYLQEKPESRNIEYMAKEKHDVIHCYRCGYVYKNGNVCPKCGSKMNR